MRVLKTIPHWIIAIAALFIICVIFFHEALFSGEIMNATDVLTQAYFWNVFIKENLFTDPCFRTWLPYINAGAPFSGGLDLLFRPMAFWTLVLLPVHVAINYEMVLYFFFFGVGMYFFMKEIGVSSISAFLAALFLMLNGETMTLMNAGHVNKMGAIFPTTLVFWTFERALRRKTLGAFLLTGAALGFAFWQGHIQISYYLCLAVGIYYVVRVGVLYARKRNVKQIAKLTVFALIMVVIFLLMTASHFLPILTFAEVSERAEGVSYDFAVTWSMPPEELITYAIPEFFGLRRLNTDDDEENLALYWGRMPFTQTGRYFGLIPLLFCILAVCFVRNKHVLTLSVLAVIALFLGMGKYIPTYRWLYDHAPGFNMFRVPQMILYLFAFATCALAGLGADWFLSGFSERKERRLRMFLLCCIIIALGAWVVTMVFPQIESIFLEKFHNVLFRKNATPEMAAERLRNIFKGLLAFNIFFGISLFALGLRLTKRLGLRSLIAILVVIYLGDIWRFDEKYLDTVPIEGSWYVNENDAIRYFKQHPGFYRIFSLTNRPSTYGVANKYVLHHLFSISGYEAVGVQYYTDYLRYMDLGTPLIDLLNIKYIILPKDMQFSEEPSIGKMIGPYKIVMNSDAVLLENPNVMPRAFPVHQSRVLTTQEDIFATLLDPRFPHAETVILEESPAGHAGPEGVLASQSQVEIMEYANRDIRLHASMAADGFVVLSEKYYRGWKAYIDGQPAPIYKADYTLQAIAVPQGEHNILFTYRPTDFWLGFWITTGTSLGLIVFGVITLKRRKLLKDVQENVSEPEIRTSRETHTTTAHVRPRQFTIFQRLKPWYFSQKLLWAIVCFGILLHAAQYVFNRSLWVDEAGVALNIIEKSYWQLLPFPSSENVHDYNQITPTGFLLCAKFLGQLFGNSEYVLRILPFFSGIASLLLFMHLCSYILPRAGRPIALLLFVAYGQLIYYSSALKPYSSDVFITLLIMWVGRKVFTANPLRLSHVLAFGGIGAISIWFAHPVVFVLAGVGGSLGIFWAFQHQWRRFRLIFISYALWLASFIPRYVMFLRHVIEVEPLRQFWGDRFMPLPPTSLKDLNWFVYTFFDLVGYVMGMPMFRPLSLLIREISQILLSWLGLSSPLSGQVSGSFFSNTLFVCTYAIATVLMVAGGIRMLRRNRLQFAWLLSPVLLNLLISGIYAYPFGNRMILFITPTFFWFLGEGSVWLFQKTKTRIPLVGIALLVLLCSHPVTSATQSLFVPRKHEEARPVLQYWLAHKQEDDVLYVYYASHSVFRYYAHLLEFQAEPYIQGIASRDNWRKYIQDFQQLRGHARVWLFFSHAYSEEAWFIAYLDSIGHRLDAFYDERASVYLYDLQ